MPTKLFRGSSLNRMKLKLKCLGVGRQAAVNTHVRAMCRGCSCNVCTDGCECLSKTRTRWRARTEERPDCNCHARRQEWTCEVPRGLGGQRRQSTARG